MSKFQAKLKTESDTQLAELGFDSEWYKNNYQCSDDTYEHYLALGHKRGFEPNPLFNTDYYETQARREGVAVIGPALLHYLKEGVNLGLKPHPLFEVSFYKSTYGLERLTDAQAYLFFLSEGASARQSPTALFDATWYYATYMKPFGSAQAPIFHYLSQPQPGHFNPSQLFNAIWYHSLYGGSIRQGYDALSHYVAFGAYHGQMPNPLFDSYFYLQQYKDVSSQGLNPLADYVTYGAQNDRFPNLFFDGKWYLETYPDVGNSQQNPLSHYLSFGAIARRDPSPLFSTRFYLNQISDSHKISNPLQDFIWRGAAIGLNPHPSFDSSAYLRTNRLSEGNPLAHLIQNFDLSLAQSLDVKTTAPKTALVAKNSDATWFNNDPANTLKILTSSKGYYPDGWCKANCFLELLSSVPTSRIGVILFVPDDFPQQEVSIQSLGSKPFRFIMEPGTPVSVSIYVGASADGVARVTLQFSHERPLSAVDLRTCAAIIDSIAAEPAGADDNRESHIKTVQSSPQPFSAPTGNARHKLPPIRHIIHATRQFPKIGIKATVKLIRDMGLIIEHFDSEYYISQLPDTETAPLHPLHHFASVGYLEGLDPNPKFSTRFYLQEYPDVKNSGLNPFVHYLLIGRREGREIAPSTAPLLAR